MTLQRIDTPPVYAPMFMAEMSQPPTTRSLGWTMGRREEKGTKTLFPNRSFPSRTVEAWAIALSWWVFVVGYIK
jgi:hypothetical protein